MKNKFLSLVIGIGCAFVCTIAFGQELSPNEIARSLPACDLERGPLKVSENNRFLVHADGSPFFYLSDTNWELFLRGRREDVERLLERRRGQGFSVIFASLTGVLDCLHFHDPLNVPNVYGDLAFRNRDVTQPIVTEGSDPDDPQAYDFWDHIDYIINVARSKGQYLAVIPAWSDQYEQGLISEENVESYAAFIAERIGKHDNVIWILGGDTHAVRSGGLGFHKRMAEVIRAKDPGEHLMSFHPRGGRSSATWFNDQEWLDFNMIQSGHEARDLPNYEKVDADYVRQPIRPTIDSENRYEGHPVNWNEINGFFNHYDNRQAAYWSMFAGAFGHAYGTRGVWQMWEPGRAKYSSVDDYWFDAMDLPGAWDMRHLRSLMLSRPFLSRVPDQGILVRQHPGARHIRVTRGNGYVMAYTASGEVIELDLDRAGIDGEEVKAWWFDPRTGEVSEIGRFPNSGIQEFDPPAISKRQVQRGNDWVLVLDQLGMGWAAPGQAELY